MPHLSLLCIESAPAFFWVPILFPLPPPPPPSLWVSLFTHLRVELVLNLSQGLRANQNFSGAFQGPKLMIPLGKEFSKRSLLVTVL